MSDILDCACQAAALSAKAACALVNTQINTPGRKRAYYIIRHVTNVRPHSSGVACPWRRQRSRRGASRFLSRTASCTCNSSTSALRCTLSTCTAASVQCTAAQTRLALLGSCAHKALACASADGKLLSLQLFVWLGHSAPQLSNLTAATPTRLSSIPSVSSLLGNDEGASLAQRLGATARFPPPHVRHLNAHARHNSAESRPAGRGLEQPAFRVSAAPGIAMLLRSVSLCSQLTRA